MGLPKGKKAGASPQHKVIIANMFAVGKFEVTRREFLHYEGHASIPSCDVPNVHAGYKPTPNYPAVCVNWDDATAYVQSLAKRTGKSYRLLSEAEWEYVARRSFAIREADCGVRSPIISEDYSGACTVAGGQSHNNDFGVYDMPGNAEEWVEDCFECLNQGAPQDGSACTAGPCEMHVIRDMLLSSTYRGGCSSKCYGDTSGFRVARTLGE
jgi:formylglycine-generating enzyme required for sulfatase activity